MAVHKMKEKCTKVVQFNDFFAEKHYGNEFS